MNVGMWPCTYYVDHFAFRNCKKIIDIEFDFMFSQNKF